MANTKPKRKRSPRKRKPKKKRSVDLSKPTVMYLILSHKSNGSSKSMKTYVGVTNDLKRRLDQHNGKKKGGAKYTRGRKWKLVCFLSGFPDRTTALRYEWRAHHPSRRRKGRNPLTRRLKTLNAMLFMEKVTKRCTKASNLNLVVNWSPGYKSLLEKECRVYDKKPLTWPTNVTNKTIKYKHKSSKQ